MVLILVVILIVAAGIFYFKNLPATANVTSSENSQPARFEPLNEEQSQIVAQSITSSGISEDVSDENPIAISFYDFDNGKRVWRSGFLIGNNKFLSEGQPEVVAIMHSKYIEEMNTENICDVVRKANKNGDFSIETDGNKAALLLKYSKLLKYQDCLS